MRNFVRCKVGYTGGGRNESKTEISTPPTNPPVVVVVVDHTQKRQPDPSILRSHGIRNQFVRRAEWYVSLRREKLKMSLDWTVFVLRSTATSYYTIATDSVASEKLFGRVNLGCRTGELCAIIRSLLVVLRMQITCDPRLSCVNVVVSVDASACVCNVHDPISNEFSKSLHSLSLARKTVRIIFYS